MKTPWISDHPAYARADMRVLVRVEKYSDKQEPQEETVMIGRFCSENRFWKNDEGKRFSEIDMSVTGWTYLPLP